MANTKNDQRLFDYIHSRGEVNNSKGLFIFDNNGPNAGEDNHYRCFVQGGICFEIHREKNEKGNWEYWLDIAWQGPFAASDSTDIIATLLWLRHELPKES